MIIVLVGRMCSGKSSVAKQLSAMGYPQFPQMTTRPPRLGEINGQDYIFVDDETFEQQKKLGLLAEFCSFQAAISDKPWWYGSHTVDYIQNRNSCVVLNNYSVSQLILNGYRKNIFIVWLDPPEDILMNRALQRGDCALEIARRSAVERQEYRSFEENYMYDLRIHDDKPAECIATDILRSLNEFERMI